MQGDACPGPSLLWKMLANPEALGWEWWDEVKAWKTGREWEGCRRATDFNRIPPGCNF